MALADRRALLAAPVLLAICLPPAATTVAQEPGPQVERIDENLFRVGTIMVDTAKREVAVPGIVNTVARGGPLEFLANTQGNAPGEPGWRAYESAVQFDTDAVTFNLALVLIGLDSSDAIDGRNFDMDKADRAQIRIAWDDDDGPRTVRAEEMLYNRDTGKTLTRSDWVYTGSYFLEDGRYLADVEGILVGFIHRSAPILEYPLNEGVGTYGHVVFNPELGLEPGDPILMTVTAIERVEP